MIPHAANKFDQQGNLTDENTAGRIKEFVRALTLWAVKHKRLNQVVEA
jgi:hypothetical protein